MVAQVRRLKFYLVEDMAREMKRRKLAIGSSSGVRKAVRERRLEPSGQTVGAGIYIWTEADAQAAFASEKQRSSRFRYRPRPRG